jgi:hypothetical protein
MPRGAPPIILDPATRATLNSWVQAASTPQALALRSRIILAAAAGRSNRRIAAELEIPEVTVGKWRRCFAAQALEGLRDAPRSGRPPNMMLRCGGKYRRHANNRSHKGAGPFGRWRGVNLPHSTAQAMLNASGCNYRVRTFTFSGSEFESNCWTLSACI